MNSLPKIGLFLLRAEWFDSVVALPELAHTIHQDEQALVNYLSRHFELAYTWKIQSANSLQECTAQLRTADFDLAVLCFQVWAEDFYLNPLAEALEGQPLAVWCYQPTSRPPRKASFLEVLRYSGAVGTLEGMGTLRNLGMPYLFTAGAPDDDRPMRELGVFARAARLRRALRKARFGLLPGRNEQMQSTFVDEFRLRADIGPVVEMLSVGDLAQAARQAPDGDIQDYLSYLQEHYRIEGVRLETLEKAARVSLGMVTLALEHRLDVLSLNDTAPEIHAVLGLRPCLYPPMLEKAGLLWGLEGDLGAATAQFILNRLTGSPCLFVEFWYWNEEENWIVGGHAGPQNPSLAALNSAWISHDYEYAQTDPTEGAHLQFIARPGRVTLLQIRCIPQGWQAIVAQGKVLEGSPWLEGYPHACVRPDVAVIQFLRQVAGVGSTQHWIMAYGDAMEEIKILAAMLKISLLEIRPDSVS